MKLLLDENLSRRLVPFLQEAFPGTTQVTAVGLERATDREIWTYARTEDFVIVSRDADFADLSSLLGAPPRLVWLRLRNPRKAAVLKLLLDNREAIHQALQGEQRACIEILASDG